MKLNRLVINGALSFALLVVSVSAFSNADDKAKLASLKSAISTLEKQLDKRDNEKNSLLAELKKAEIAAAQANQNIRQLNIKIDQLGNNISGLGRQQTKLKSSIKKQNAMVSEQLAAAYKMGNQEPIKLLLNQEDPQQLARLLKYYSYILEARNEKISNYIADVDRLSALQMKSIEQKRLLDSAKTELEKDQQTLLAQHQAKTGHSQATQCVAAK